VTRMAFSRLRGVARLDYAAVALFTLAAVAIACSHNHAHAPLVAAGLALAGATAVWRHRALARAR